MNLDPRTHAAIEITKALIMSHPKIIFMGGTERDALIGGALSLLSEVSDTLESEGHHSFFVEKEGA